MADTTTFTGKAGLNAYGQYDWFDANNWSNGIPNSKMSNTIINSDYFPSGITINISSNDSSIISLKNLEIEGNNGVSIYGDNKSTDAYLQADTINNTSSSSFVISGNPSITATHLIGTSGVSFDGTGSAYLGIIEPTTVTITLPGNSTSPVFHPNISVNYPATIKNITHDDIITLGTSSSSQAEWHKNTDGTYNLTILDSSQSPAVTVTLLTNSTLASGLTPADMSWVAGTSDSSATLNCFLNGSHIQTPSGTILVENLVAGDEVVTYIDGVETIRRVTWTGQAHCNVRSHLPDDEAGYPVRILKDAISDGVPFKDMLITAEHCLFFDGKFVPARMLVNGRSIYFDKSITSYDYYHIETAVHSVIMADGMLTESYLDTGNRSTFSQKGNVVSIGSSRNLSWDDASAPLTVSRETVEPLFRKIENRADKAGVAIQTEARPLTNESDLHLTTDTGAVIRPARQNNGRVMFMIPSGVESVRIVSNASRPCDVVGPFIDDRRSLGVLVGTVTLFESNRTRTLTDHLHDAQLSGWSNVEEGTMRWTSGNALLPLGERTPGALALMAIEVKAAGPYVLDETLSEHHALKA